MRAVINGCERSTTFDVIEPEVVNYTPCPLTVAHNGGQRHIQFYLKMDLDPDTVSFYNVVVREKSGEGSDGTGDFAGDEPYHFASMRWLNIRPDNTVIGRDEAKAAPRPDDLRVGSFMWKIPIEYAVIGGVSEYELDKKVEQKFVVTSTCVTVEKGGLSETGCSTNMDTTQPNTTGCGINDN